MLGEGAVAAVVAHDEEAPAEEPDGVPPHDLMEGGVESEWMSSRGVESVESES